MAHRIIGTADDLFDILTQNFESENTISVLLSQLLQIKGSDCKDLGNKIASIRDKLIIAVSNERIASPAALIEKFAMIKYIDNLPSEINLITKAKNPLNLDKAIEVAVEEERYMKNRSKSNIKDKYKEKPKYKAPVSRDDRFNKPSTSSSDNTKTCEYCKKLGHTKDNCYKRKQNSDRNKIRNVKTYDTDSSSDSEDEREIQNLNSDREESTEDPLLE